MRRLEPLGDRVIVRVKKVPEMSGGIVIPQSARERSNFAEVIAVGPGRNDDRPMALKVGMEVMLARDSGIEFKLNNEELIIIREDEILGVVKGNG